MMTFEEWFSKAGIGADVKPIENRLMFMMLERLAKEAWQASRENQQEYQKHEFCRDMNCSYLKKDKCELKPGCCNITSGSG
jgi:hypothetical protein